MNDVSLTGAGAAVSSLRQCLAPSNSNTFAQASVVPSRGFGTYAGWNYSFKSDDCSLSRQTDEGSGVAMSHSFSNDRLTVDIHFVDGTRGRPGHWNAKTRLVLIAPAQGSASARLIDDGTIIDLNSAGFKDSALFAGEVDGSFLLKLTQQDWDQLVIRSLPGESLELDQHLTLTGSQPVFLALQRCAQALPPSPF